MRSSAWIPPFFPIRKKILSKGSPGRFEGENRTKQFFSNVFDIFTWSLKTGRFCILGTF